MTLPSSSSDSSDSSSESDDEPYSESVLSGVRSRVVMNASIIVTNNFVETNSTNTDDSFTNLCGFKTFFPNFLVGHFEKKRFHPYIKL